MGILEKVMKVEAEKAKNFTEYQKGYKDGYSQGNDDGFQRGYSEAKKKYRQPDFYEPLDD